MKKQRSPHADTGTLGFSACPTVQEPLKVLYRILKQVQLPFWKLKPFKNP